jgi:hypothetical protein
VTLCYYGKMTTKRQKHLNESWVVKANRERDRLQDEESRAKFEEFREDIKARLKGPHAASQYEFPEVPSRAEVGED